MLIAAQQLDGSQIEGKDGIVGTLRDILFDGTDWNIRYFEIDTGQWLPGRRVILPPQIVENADYALKRLYTSLSRDQIEQSPTIEQDLPVSRQKEAELAKHFGWGMAWANLEQRTNQAQADTNLRSINAINGYRIQATDGEIGHVTEFIVDDEGADAGRDEGQGDRPWIIRYLVIDTRNWLPGRQVLIPPVWAEAIHWDSRKIDLELTREVIENSPEYDPTTSINRRYEEVLYDFYGRPRYWTDYKGVS